MVIYRLPKMMIRAWREEAREILELSPVEESPTPFNLIVPSSACPECRHKITALENIPIISYFFILKGKCRGCGQKISLEYPIVEAITGLLAVWVIWHFGWNEQGWAAVLFVFALVAMTGIDMKTQLLPDLITMPLMWIGVLLATQNVFIPLSTAVWGAVIGYMSLWSIAMLFKLATGKDGMGGGDMKLLGAFGAWMGAMSLPTLVLVACAVGLTMAVVNKLGKGEAMPFGPALCVAGFLTLLYGNEIGKTFLGVYGI